MKPEAQILRTITDWLSAERIWWRRRNAGAAFIEGRKIGYGVAGDSDLEVLHRRDLDYKIGSKATYLQVVFIEVKAPKGKQSEAQKRFQEEVTALGCTYVLAYSVEDVMKAMGR